MTKFRLNSYVFEILSPSSPIMGKNWKHDLARSCFMLQIFWQTCLCHENIQLAEVSPVLLRHHRSSTIHVITSQGSPKREAFFENLLWPWLASPNILLRQLEATVIVPQDKDNDKDDDKDKDTDKLTERLYMCYIFEMPKTQAFQVWCWIPPTGHHRHHSCPLKPLGPCLSHAHNESCT